MNRLPTILTGIAGTTLLALTGAAHAQPGVAEDRYDVRHQFRLGPGVPGVTPKVEHFGFAHAWVVDPMWQEARYFHPVQNPGFDEYGTDSLGGSGIAYNSGGPAVVYSTAPTPDTGFAGTFCVQVWSPFSGSTATACCDYDIRPFGPGTVVEGSFGATGSTRASAGPGVAFARAYAFSTSAAWISRRSTPRGRSSGPPPSMWSGAAPAASRSARTP